MKDATEPKPKLRIVLVQENPVLRIGLKYLVEKQNEFSIVAGFDKLAEALVAIPRLQPDLVVTDWDIADQSATVFLTEVHRLAPACKTLVLSAQDSEGCARAALRAGADGFIGLFADLPELTSAIRAVSAGRQYICNSTATRILKAHISSHRPAAPAPLKRESITGREQEVLTSIALGNSNKGIAKELGLSPKTIEKHRSNLMRKLHLHNAAAITMYAIRNGMIVGPASRDKAPQLDSASRHRDLAAGSEALGSEALDQQAHEVGGSWQVALHAQQPTKIPDAGAASRLHEEARIESIATLTALTIRKASRAMYAGSPSDLGTADSEHSD